MENVAVLIQAQNSAGYIDRTLRSVLGQTGVDVDVLAIDDASTDGTVDDVRSIRDPRVTLVESPSAVGEARCLNVLLERARAPWVVTVPDDAVLLPGALLRIVEVLTRSPRVGLAYAGAFPLDADGSATREMVYRRARIYARRTAQYGGVDYLLAFGDQALGLVAYRRAALDEVGKFAEALEGEARLDAAFRIARRYDVDQIAELLCARGRGDSCRLTASLFDLASLRHRMRLYRRSALATKGRNKRAVAAWGRVVVAVGVEQARALGSASIRAVRTHLVWSVVVPLGERLYDWVLANFANWPIGAMCRKRTTPRPRKRIAYYLWRYPVLSETFIARELAALEGAGVDVQVIADAPDYGPPVSADHLPRIRSTEYLAPVPAGSLVRDLTRVVIRRPLRMANLLAYIVFRAYRRPKSIRDDAQVFVRAVRLASALQKRGIEHVHSPWGNVSAFIAMVAARLAGVGYSVQFRAHDIHRRTAAFLLPEKIRNAEFVVTNSSFNEAHLRSLVSAQDREKIHRIYNGLDLSSFRGARPPSDERAGVRILSVARLIEAKGLVYLLEACWALRERGHRFRCEVVGAPELPLYVNDYIEIKSRHRRLDLGDCVQFLGPLPFARVLECYGRADIFVLPCVVAKDGSNDITPNSLLEAMAMGLPVVSTRITAIPEIVEDGRSGILVPPKDSDALRDQIARLIDDPGLRRWLGANARKQVEERFDIETNIRAYVDLFRAS